MTTGKPAPLFFRNDYAQRLKKLFEPSIVSYLPLDEPRGSVAFDYSGKGNVGAYTAVTLGQLGIGDGRSAGSFDGSTSFCNWYSAALASAFNGAAGTLIAWAKVANAGMWTAGGVSMVIQNLGADASANMVDIRRASGDNSMQLRYFAGGVSKDIGVVVGPTLDWFHIGLTWSITENIVRTYLNSIPKTTAGSLGTWSGNLASNLCVIGARNTTPTFVWNGLIAHVLLLNRAATAAEVQEAYRMAF